MKEREKINCYKVYISQKIIVILCIVTLIFFRLSIMAFSGNNTLFFGKITFDIISKKVDILGGLASLFLALAALYIAIICCINRIEVCNQNITIKRFLKPKTVYQFSQLSSYGKDENGIYLKVRFKTVVKGISKLLYRNVDFLEEDLKKWDVSYLGYEKKYHYYYDSFETERQYQKRIKAEKEKKRKKEL